MAVFPTDAVSRLAKYNSDTYAPVDNPYGMADGGHRQNFPQATTDLTIVAEFVQESADEIQGYAQDAIASAQSAQQSAIVATEGGLRLSGTSTTSRTPALGSLQFTTQAGKAFDVGQFLKIQSRGTPGRWAYGQVTEYIGTSVTVAVELIGPTATAGADWNIIVSGARGVAGPPAEVATVAEILAGTDNVKSVTPKAFRDTANVLPLTTAAVPMGQALNFSRTLTDNVSFNAPTGAFAGASGTFFISQDGTGNRTASWNTFWDFGPDGPPTLSAGAGVMDYVFYVVAPGATRAICSFKAGAS